VSHAESSEARKHGDAGDVLRLSDAAKRRACDHRLGKRRFAENRSALAAVVCALPRAKGLPQPFRLLGSDVAAIPVSCCWPPGSRGFIHHRSACRTQALGDGRADPLPTRRVTTYLWMAAPIPLRRAGHDRYPCLSNRSWNSSLATAAVQLCYQPPVRNSPRSRRFSSATRSRLPRFAGKGRENCAWATPGWARQPKTSKPMKNTALSAVPPGLRVPIEDRQETLDRPPPVPLGGR